MKKPIYSLAIVLILSVLGLAACNLEAATPTSLPGLAYTQAAQTVQALLTQPAPTNPITIVTITNTPETPAVTPARLSPPRLPSSRRRPSHPRQKTAPT